MYITEMAHKHKTILFDILNPKTEIITKNNEKYLKLSYRVVMEVPVKND